MHINLVVSSLLLAAGAAQAATSWGFGDASVTIAAKKAGPNTVEKFTDKSPVLSPLTLSHVETLNVALTAKDNGKGKRPHQAFLLLTEPDSGLQAPFLLDVKSTGKASVVISHKDLPIQLLTSSSPLQASIIIGSFGSATPLHAAAFEVRIVADPNAPIPKYDKPLRYGKKPEIHHIFRPDPESPPVAVSLLFLAVVVATLPGLFVAWVVIGANLSHLPKALAAAPVSHALFFGSVVAIESVLFLYYASWNLFQMLPATGVLGIVAFLSGSRALSEVQGRRLAGQR